MLELEVEFSFASELCMDASRSLHLLKICNFYNATNYLSPIGSQNYLLADNCFNNSDVKLEFLNFIPRKYKQRGTNSFVSHLSIIDVIAHLGIEGGRAYLDNARLC